MGSLWDAFLVFWIKNGGLNEGLKKCRKQWQQAIPGKFATGGASPYRRGSSTPFFLEGLQNLTWPQTRPVCLEGTVADIICKVAQHGIDADDLQLFAVSGQSRPRELLEPHPDRLADGLRGRHFHLFAVGVMVAERLHGS